MSEIKLRNSYKLTMCVKSLDSRVFSGRLRSLNMGRPNLPLCPKNCVSHVIIICVFRFKPNHALSLQSPAYNSFFASAQLFYFRDIKYCVRTVQGGSGKRVRSVAKLKSWSKKRVRKKTHDLHWRKAISGEKRWRKPLTH